MTNVFLRIIFQIKKMEKLTQKEEEIMQIFWDIEKGFVKDIIAKLQDDKIPYTTISSIVRILENKGFISHNTYGNTYEYYPIVSKSDYKQSIFPEFVTRYFDNSIKNVVSFLVEGEKLTKEDIAELKELISKLND